MSEPKETLQSGDAISSLARLFWCLFGPMLLLVLAILIFEKGGGGGSLASVAYLAVLALTVIARWVDHRSGQSETVTGQLATDRDLHRYLCTFPAICLLIWMLVNGFGNR